MSGLRVDVCAAFVAVAVVSAVLPIPVYSQGSQPCFCDAGSPEACDLLGMGGQPCGPNQTPCGRVLSLSAPCPQVAECQGPPGKSGTNIIYSYCFYFEQKCEHGVCVTGDEEQVQPFACHIPAGLDCAA